MSTETPKKFFEGKEQWFRADDLAISQASMSAKGVSVHEAYWSDSGFVRLRPTLAIIDGVPQGRLSIGDSPSTVDIDDCWEWNKPSRHWSYWSFLQFLVVPTGEDSPPDFLLFIGGNTPMERPHQVLLRCPVPGGWFGNFESEDDGGDGASAEIDGDESDQDESDRVDTDGGETGSGDIEKSDEEVWWDRIRSLIADNFELGVLSEQIWTVDGERFDSTFPDF
jgi:hypothetical protein